MYIGIDLGTTGCKCALYDHKGRCLSQFNQEYPLITSGSYVEQDANLWRKLVCEGIRSVTAAAGVFSISALSISTQGISVVAVDAEGNPLANAISWLDERAESEMQKIEEQFGAAEIYRRTGKPCDPCYTFPKLLWLKEHDPALFKGAARFLLPLDFLNLYLTGRAVTDYTIAGGTMLFDLEKKIWAPEFLDFLGLPAEKLPEVSCMGRPVGRLLPEIAEELGINRAEVILGGQDQKLAAIGAGISEHICTVSFGTATAVSSLSKGMSGDDRFAQFRLNDGQFIREGVVSTSGAALRWLASVAFGGKSYREMDELAQTSEKGANGVVFTPDFTGNAKIEGLTLSTTQGDIVYALYEGVCRGISVCLPDDAEELVVFGGGSKSDIWCRILSDITGRTVSVCDSPETACLGAVRLASEMTVPSVGKSRHFLCK